MSFFRFTHQRVVALAAGLMDSLTGLALIGFPHATAHLMGVTATPETAPYLRFLGAFVFAIGSLYIVGERYALAKRFTEWALLWRTTAWVRLCVGTTVLGMIITGALEIAWLAVPLADLSLAVYQFLNRAPAAQRRPADARASTTALNSTVPCP